MTFGFTRPEAASPCGGLNLLRSIWKAHIARQGRESGHRGIELEFDGSCRAMALLTNDHLGLTVDFVRLCQPFRELLTIGFQRLAHLVIIFLPINEQDDVGVLLD